MPSIKNLEERKIYDAPNHPIVTLAAVYERVHCYNELWEVLETEKGELYALVNKGQDKNGRFEERFYFSMKDVHRELGVEIGLYKDIVNFFCCETVYLP